MRSSKMRNFDLTRTFQIIVKIQTWLKLIINYIQTFGIVIKAIINKIFKKNRNSGIKKDPKANDMII